MTPGAARAVIAAAKRKAATPPDVAALLERGRRERTELDRQAAALRALGKIEAIAAAKLVKIQQAKHPATRANLLGELADWIIERRDTLIVAAGISPFRRIRSEKSRRRVPAWVPADLQPVYLDPLLDECEAASLVRQMKRGRVEALTEAQAE